jgi:hypothetical protein
MDTSKLVVRQEIRMFSGHYTCTVKVAELLPDGVTAEGEYGTTLRFNRLSKGFCVDWSRVTEHIDCPSGPWFIEGVDWQSKDVIESTVEQSPYRSRTLNRRR